MYWWLGHSYTRSDGGEAENDGWRVTGGEVESDEGEVESDGWRGGE